MFHHICLFFALSSLTMFILGFVYWNEYYYFVPTSIGLYFTYPIFLEIMYLIFTSLFCSKSTSRNIISKINSKQIVPDSKLPIVYSNSYNITACGVEKLHPFDSCKYQKSKLYDK